MSISPIDNSILSVNSPSPADRASQARTVAREFESLFASFMLRSMRKTVGENELIPTSTGEKIYTDMLDQEYAKLLSSRGNLGLADMILKQIEKNGDDGTDGLAALRGLRNQSWMLDKRFVPSGRQAVDFAALRRGVQQWDRYIDEASARYGLDRSLVAAVIAQESGGNPAALSPAGAKGLMQIMDSTAAELGLQNAYNPRENVLAGARYLRQMLDRHNGDEQRALASYNAGPGAVDQYGGVPPYPETLNYVARVRQLRQQFARSAAAAEGAMADGSAE